MENKVLTIKFPDFKGMHEIVLPLEFENGEYVFRCNEESLQEMLNVLKRKITISVVLK